MSACLTPLSSRLLAPGAARRGSAPGRIATARFEELADAAFWEETLRDPSRSSIRRVARRAGSLSICRAGSATCTHRSVNALG